MSLQPLLLGLVILLLFHVVAGLDGMPHSGSKPGSRKRGPSRSHHSMNSPADGELYVLHMASSCKDRKAVHWHSTAGAADYQQVERELELFFQHAQTAQHTIQEIAEEVAWLLADVEFSCTPGLNRGDFVYEKLSALAWKMLHHAHATRRATLAQLDVWQQHSQPAGEIVLLQNRIR